MTDNESSDGIDGGSDPFLVEAGHLERHELYDVVHESETTRILRRGGWGIKMLSGPDTDSDNLQIEQRVSRVLPSSCSQRKVLRVDTGGHVPGMHFEWVDGATADEWLRSEAATQLPLIARLQVAVAITRAVCDFHEAGVYHGNLSPKNVILKFDEGSSFLCTATLIDYAKSVVVSDCLHSISDKQERLAYIEAASRKDLHDLGAVIYSVLGNNTQGSGGDDEEEDSNPDDSLEGQRKKRGRRQQTQPTNNLPLYLVSLVTSMITPSSDERSDDRVFYTKAKDVLSDLQLAIDKPEVYLKLHSTDDLVSRSLTLPESSFYGRKTELLMLRQSFDAMMEGKSKPCAVVVSGYAGAG